MFPRVKASTTARGYGISHVKARKQAAARHSPTDPCARCGHPLGVMGPWLHLDHNDQRSGYLGFSHGARPCPICRRRCNKVAGASKGAKVANAKAVKRLAPSTYTRW
jgi:hypothetical protein